MRNYRLRVNYTKLKFTDAVSTGVRDHIYNNWLWIKFKTSVWYWLGDHND